MKRGCCTNFWLHGSFLFWRAYLWHDRTHFDVTFFDAERFFPWRIYAQVLQSNSQMVKCGNSLQIHACPKKSLITASKCFREEIHVLSQIKKTSHLNKTIPLFSMRPKTLTILINRKDNTCLNFHWLLWNSAVFMHIFVFFPLFPFINRDYWKYIPKDHLKGLFTFQLTFSMTMTDILRQFPYLLGFSVI